MSEATALSLQTTVALTAGDTVELHGDFRVADGYVAGERTVYWGRRLAEREVETRRPYLSRYRRCAIDAL